MHKIYAFVPSICLIVFILFAWSCKNNTSPDVDNRPVYEESGIVDDSGAIIQISDENSLLNGTYLDIPQNALDENVNVSISQVEEFEFVDDTALVVDFSPSGTQFSQPVEIGIPYKEGSDISNLQLYRYDIETEAWEVLPIERIDTSMKIVVSKVTHFSWYTTGDHCSMFDLSVYRTNNGKLKLHIQAPQLNEIPTTLMYSLYGYPNMQQIINGNPFNIRPRAWFTVAVKQDTWFFPQTLCSNSIFYQRYSQYSDWGNWKAEIRDRYNSLLFQCDQSFDLNELSNFFSGLPYFIETDSFDTNSNFLVEVCFYYSKSDDYAIAYSSNQRITPIYSFCIKNINYNQLTYVPSYLDGNGNNVNDLYEDTGTVALPAFSPPAGTYNSPLSVTISCATSGATIRYTTNGSEPTANSPIYNSSISLTANTLIKAKAFKTGWNPSYTASASYSVTNMSTVATPTISPSAGTYNSPLSVTISCATSGATIRYTINGLEPTPSSPVYNTPIPVSATTSIKAKAYKSGWTPSATASATYTINIPIVATPAFSPPGGTYSTAQSVGISCATSGATIRYTTNGSEPTSSSTVYSGPINVSTTTTIKAKAYKSGWTPSTTASATYTISSDQTVATPTFSPPGGTYSTAQSVGISCATSGATIRYTTNGSEPTESSAQYTDPVNISTTTTLKAKAYKSGWTPSATASATYTISSDQTVATPTFSPPGGTYSTAQSVIISCATSGATIRYTTNGSEPTSSSTVYSGPINVSTTTTIKAKAYKSGWTPSATASATYNIGATPGQMIFVPGGTFTMGDTHGVGSSDELPTHSVTLNSFYIGKYEVTQAEYAQYMQPGDSWTSNYGLGDNYPAYYVSWYAILKYCNLRSMAEGLTPVYTINGSTDPANWGSVPTGYNTAWNAAICNWNANGYRLPTEAEWEYAARGAVDPPDYLYSGSDDINAVAWYGGNNSPYGSKLVGTKAPNELGTYDMSGNLWEWCWDWYSSSYYSSSPASNPTGPVSGSYRLLRGGNWSGNAGHCRVADRDSVVPCNCVFFFGFRLCRAIN